jgi:hypothetical protein
MSDEPTTDIVTSKRAPLFEVFNVSLRRGPPTAVARSDSPSEKFIFKLKALRPGAGA